MKKPKFSISTKIVASCCGKESKPFQYEHYALEWLWRHIARSHKELHVRLERRARELARSQNGCGYYDTDKNDGWAKAQLCFRHHWREKALKYEITSP